jgi:hypothetical protein
MNASHPFKIEGKITVRKVIGRVLQLLICGILFIPCTILYYIGEWAPIILDMIGTFIDYLFAKIEKYDGTAEEVEAEQMWDRLSRK